jgi:predicted RNA-binding Zn-ribbon protein involved in translation (DUF1610 family)
MRVNTVKKARKDQGTCPSCGKAIKAGDAYKWAKGRYTAKKIRCESCAFRQSDLTSSDKLSQVYAAQEGAEDAMAEWAGEEGEAQAIMENLAEAVREVANEYQESADNIHEHFSESEKADECEERSQELEQWADECEQVGEEAEFDADDIDFDEDDVDVEDCENDDERKERIEKAREEKVEEARTEWKDNLESAMSDAIGSCPV